MNAAFQIRIQKYGWDKAASIYEQYWQEQLKPAQDLLIEMADLKPGDNVLDIACGTGLVSLRAAEKIIPGGFLTGIDLSEKMVKTAEKTAEKGEIKNTRFLCMGAEELKFEYSEFNAALCSLGLMYVPDPQKSINEVYKVLMPGGRFISAVWGERNKCGWAGIFPVVDARVKSEVCPLFFFLGTRDALERHYKAAGFKDIESRRINTILFYEDEESALGAAFAGGPVALAYSRFSDEVKESAHIEYLETIEKFKNSSGYNIPGEFVIVKGTRDILPG